MFYTVHPFHYMSWLSGLSTMFSVYHSSLQEADTLTAVIHREDAMS